MGYHQVLIQWLDLELRVVVVVVGVQVGLVGY